MAVWVFRFPFFYENEKWMKVLKIQRKNLLNMKMVVKSVYRKYNSLLDLKTKRILKIFHFSFFNFKKKIEKWKNFWNSVFDFKSKNEIEKFEFCFLKLVLNQNRFKKFFFTFLVLQFNNQIWKMKDIFWNSFFHFKSKNQLENFDFYFLFFFLKWVTSKFVLIGGF